MPENHSGGLIDRAKRFFAMCAEWHSIRYSKKPRLIILLAICTLNIALVLVSAWVISAFAIGGATQHGFFTAVYNTLTMIFDAGCIESIIEDPGSANVFLMIFCLVIIVIGMITFTGALIGYVTNFISSFIDEANANSRKLRISGHLVILGWNTRASEIVNDLLFRPGPQKVVILAETNGEKITREIEERLNDTIRKENAELRYNIRMDSLLKRCCEYHKHKLRNNITFIVREGDIFSSVHMKNIQVEKAESIIILSNGVQNTACPAGLNKTFDETYNDDSRTIKALMQVVDIASSSSSGDDQKVVVEVENEWTEQLVEMIIKTKQKLGKCRVVPFRVHRVMGQLLSQFSLMPELNLVYKDLFSNKGATFYSVKQKKEDRSLIYIDEYFKTHCHAVPLTFMKDDMEKKEYFYYVANDEKDYETVTKDKNADIPIKLNHHYWMSEKYVLILGSNSKIINVMNGFQSFCNEWTDRDHPRMLHATIIDSEERLKHFNYFRDYPFVESCISAEIHEQNIIISRIAEFINNHPNESSILILSDDMAKGDEVDSKALTFLIDAKDSINRAKTNKRNENFNIDIVVEIIDPKHYDILKSYDVNNVVISNRYISKMVTQISENYALYNFYTDIMTYDSDNASAFDSKEVYIKRAGDYFEEIPAPNTPVDALIRSVYNSSRRFWGSESDFAIIIGYIDTLGNMRIFSGPQNKQVVSLKPDDKLIIFSNH